MSRTYRFSVAELQKCELTYSNGRVFKNGLPWDTSHSATGHFGDVAGKENVLMFSSGRVFAFSVETP